MLLSSDGWQRWLRSRARFHRYSFRNTLLIALQFPEATRVAGFHAWIDLGRGVRKGETGIRIFAPVTSHCRTDEPEQPGEESQNQERRVVGFRVACVFDVSQTDPLPNVEPAPLEPPSQPVTGDSHIHLLPQLEAYAQALGYQVNYEPLERESGYCSARENRIVVDSNLPGNARVATLVHEIAHAHGVDYRAYGRAEAELVVESVACIVCGAVGLDTGNESVPYLLDWNDDQAVERIGNLAGTIDQVASAIEAALDIDPHTTPDTPD
jgi:antirestriction protein ArdC